MTALGVHVTDLFLSLAGRPKRVQARTGRIMSGAIGEDHVSVSLEFDSGATGMLVCLSTTPYHGRLTVFGTDGWIEVKENANVDQGQPSDVTIADRAARRSTVSYPPTNTVLANFDAWARPWRGRAPIGIRPSRSSTTSASWRRSSARPPPARSRSRSRRARHQLTREAPLKLGFIGLGRMGQAIVPRLLAAGHEVTGWNRGRARAEPLLARGMRWADSPRAAAANAEIVFSSVTNTAAVQAVALGEDGVLAGLAPGGVFVEMSTISPDGSRAIAAEFARAGRHMLDAPISGSPITLAEARRR